MSTKTSIKRIALVAVSALGFGLLSVAPSSAAQTAAAGTISAINLTAATANTNVTGSAVNVYFGASAANAELDDTETMFFAAALTSYPASGYVTVAGVNAGATLTWAGAAAADTASGSVVTLTLGGDATATTGTGTVTAIGTDGLGKFAFTPSVAGDYVMTVWNDVNENGSIDLTEARQTISLTVAAATVTKFAVGRTTALFDDVDSDGVVAADATAAITSFSKSAGDVGAIEINLYGDDAQAWAGTGVTISATISGSGLIIGSTADNVDAMKTAVTANARVASISDATDTVGIVIGSDGTAGTGTVTVSATYDSVTTVIGTKTVTFFGDVATVTAAQRLSVAPVNATLGGTTSTTYAVAVTVKDAGGNPIQGKTIATVSSDTIVLAESNTCTTTDSAGVSYCDVDGAATAKSGNTATLTFSTTNAAAVAVKTSAVSFAIGGAAYSATLAFDKATYAPGEAAVVTITAKDSSGNTATDGQVFAASTITSSVATQGLPNAAAVTTVAGTATLEIYAPATSGAWTISATDGSSTVVSASAVVSGGAAEEAAASAADAAAEAIDAANAATDAANLAAEAADAATVAAEEARDAADAATAAVEELATQVATLMAALKAQITTLANTVAKIAKKVKA